MSHNTRPNEFNATSPTEFTTRLARVAALLAIVVGLAVVSPSASSPVSAHTSGGNATGGGQWHPWPSDGCTKVPNWMPGIYNFTHACQHHDGCYVGRWAERATCDQWFLNDMNASCGTGSTLFTQRSRCRTIALAYYLGVRECGDYSYQQRSISTPLNRLCW